MFEGVLPGDAGLLTAVGEKLIVAVIFICEPKVKLCVGNIPHRGT